MVINIASFGGRSHLLDTARELAKCGHIVRFYSYVPKKRALKFGLPAECSFSLYYWALPFLILFKLFGFKDWNLRIYRVFFDYFLSVYMKPCDIFIGQSPMHLVSLKAMKKKYNAYTILERGTSHVYDYIENLKDNPKYANKVFKSNYDKLRDVKAYQYPDYICVGAEHVKESFIKYGFKPEKIFVNNYGCNINYFHPTVLDKNNYWFDIIQVGQWGYRKGADIITECCKKYGFRFLHVGSITDIPFPNNIENMTHVNAVQEQNLINYYKKAKVFIMPSREEGLALVQVQAVVCGLPLICSKRSGGRDLIKYLENKEMIIEMNELTCDELYKCIKEALILHDKLPIQRTYINNEYLEDITWTGYGKRYDEFINKISNDKDIKQ